MKESEKSRLIAENQELKRKLQEADDVIRAIRTGAVDAIIVSGDNGDNVFSLSSAETPYRILIEQMQEGAVTITDEGLILYSNQRFSSMIGLPNSQITGSSFYSFIEQDDLGKFRTLLEYGKKDGRSTGVFRIVSATENQEFCLLTANSLPEGSAGDLCLIVSNIDELKKFEEHLSALVKDQTRELEATNRLLYKDIEKRKVIEEKLSKSEHTLSYFLDTVPVGIIRYNSEGVVHDANDRFLEMLGYTRKEMKQGEITLEHLIIKEQSRKKGDIVEEYLIKGSYFPYEKDYLKKDGSILPVLISSVMVDQVSREGIGFVLDISDMKKAEEKLRFNEFILLEAQRIANMGSWQYDIKNAKVKWSENLYRMFEQDPETFEPTLEKLFNLIHPDDSPAVSKIIQESIGKNEKYSTEYRIITKNGEIKYMQTYANTIVSGGNPLIVGTTMDISQIKKAEETIIKAKAEAEFERNRLKALLQASSSGIMIIEGPTNKISFSNEKAKAIFGRDLDTIQNPNHSKLGMLTLEKYPFYPGGADTGHFSLAQEHHGIELIIKKPDNTEIVASVSTAPLIDKDGKIEAVIAVMEDITLKKDFEDQLIKAKRIAEEQKNRLEAIYRITPSGIVIVEKEGGVFSFVNETAKKIYGIDPTGRSMEDMKEVSLLSADEEPLNPEDLPPYRSLTKGELVTGEELIVKKPDGSKVAVMVSTSPFYNYQGEIEAMVGIFQDISLLKNNEKELLTINEELSLFNNAMIGRELRMIELKKEINELYVKLGQPERYEVDTEEVI